jgi:hypothetical protein
LPWKISEFVSIAPWKKKKPNVKMVIKQFGNERQTKQKTCVYVLCIHAENRGKDR